MVDKPEVAKDSLDMLASFIKENYRGEAGIVYAFSRKEASDVAAGLTSRGIRAAFYHAGQEVRLAAPAPADAAIVGLCWCCEAPPPSSPPVPVSCTREFNLGNSTSSTSVLIRWVPYPKSTAREKCWTPPPLLT